MLIPLGAIDCFVKTINVGLGALLVVLTYSGRQISANRYIVKCISWLSIASFPAYLFHRQLYYLFFNISIPVYVHGILIFVISYYIQILYNKSVNVILCKKRKDFQ